MIGKEKLFKKLESVMRHSDADQTEIVYIGVETGLTRRGAPLKLVWAGLVPYHSPVSEDPYGSDDLMLEVFCRDK